MGVNCALHCLQGKSFGRIIPFVPHLCCVSNDLSKGGNRRSNRFFSGCVLFDVFIYHLPQQLKYIVPNSNFTVKQGWNILDKFYEVPPCYLVYPKLWLTLGDSATGNAVDNDGAIVTGDDNNNGDHDGDSDGNGDGTMGSCGQGIYPKKIARWSTVESLDTMVFNFHLYLKVSKSKTFVINLYKKNSTTIISFPNWTTRQNILFQTGKLWSIYLIMLIPRRYLLCMSNKQRTQRHTKSIISKAHKHHTPKYNYQRTASKSHINHWGKYLQLSIKKV